MFSLRDVDCFTRVELLGLDTSGSKWYNGILYYVVVLVMVMVVGTIVCFSRLISGTDRRKIFANIL